MNRVASSRGKGGAALVGRLAEVSLFDICQFLMLNRKTGTLTARDGKHTVYLTFQEGQLLNALDEKLVSGEEVVLGAVQWADGEFSFDSGPVDPTQKIHNSTENVLLEAARQLDEMSAGDLLEDDGEPAPTHVDRFQEMNRRTAELSDAFRKAVAFEEDTSSLGAEWKHSIVDALQEGRAERVLVGPDDLVYVVHASGATAVEVRSFAEVEEWVSTLCPADPEWDPKSGRTVGCWATGSPQSRLWVSRHSGPEGAWFSISCPTSEFPNWEGMGFQADLGNALDRSPKAVLLSSAMERLLEQSVASWVARAVQAAPCLGWVIEPFPSYDWAKLPGRIRQISPNSLSEPDSLIDLCDRTHPRVIVLRSIEDRELVGAALRASNRDVRVLLASPASSILDALQRLEGVLTGSHLPPPREARLPEYLSAAWWVEAGSAAQPYPVRTRFVQEKPRAAAA